MKWYTCPICQNHLLKVEDDFEAEGVYIKCKKCKNDIEIRRKQSHRPNRARAREPEP